MIFKIALALRFADIINTSWHLFETPGSNLSLFSKGGGRNSAHTLPPPVLIPIWFFVNTSQTTHGPSWPNHTNQPSFFPTTYFKSFHAIFAKFFPLVLHLRILKNLNFQKKIWSVTVNKIQLISYVTLWNMITE